MGLGKPSEEPVPDHSPTSVAEAGPVILTEVRDRIGTITMNRPERRNALNGELMGALDATVREMAEDEEVKVVILTGAPPEGGLGGFCSGGDIKSGGRERAWRAGGRTDRRPVTS